MKKQNVYRASQSESSYKICPPIFASHSRYHVHACNNSCYAVHRKQHAQKTRGKPKGSMIPNTKVMQACLMQTLFSFNFASTAVRVEN